MRRGARWRGSPAQSRIGRPGESACAAATPGRSATSARPAGRPVEFGYYEAQVVDEVVGSFSTTRCIGYPVGAAQFAPAVERVIHPASRDPRSVSADRGYRETSVKDALHDSGWAPSSFPAWAKRAMPGGQKNMGARSDAP